MFEAETLNSQLFLTRVLQSLASANTRMIVELLAQGPRSRAELLQVMDSTESRIGAAMLVLQAVGLVSEGRDREGETVYLFNQSGLDIARSWLDRVDTIAGRPSQS
jgi:DNA-binding transcriptional ArsR family regulator